MSIVGDGQGGIPWRKSRFSLGTGACVEVASVAPGVLIRDSANPESPVLRCSARAWRALTMSARDGTLGSQTFVR
jgi:hypothetical protein